MRLPQPEVLSLERDGIERQYVPCEAALQERVMLATSLPGMRQCDVSLLYFE
jgi:hypothetical protein